MRNKLIVAGCSVSDRQCGATICYGDVLADKLDYEYIHHGSSIGSNFRIWRVVTNMIMNKEITPEDKVVIQYTNTTRQEFWTSHKDTSDLMDYKDFGHLIKFKMNLIQTHALHKKNQEFFKLYEDGHVNIDYANEVFAVNHFNFANTLVAHNINAVFLNAFNYLGDNLLILPQELNAMYISHSNLLPEHTDNDGYHFSDEGHIFVANRLYDYYQNK